VQLLLVGIRPGIGGGRCPISQNETMLSRDSRNVTKRELPDVLFWLDSVAKFGQVPIGAVLKYSAPFRTFFAFGADWCFALIRTISHLP
jgi:hypothetical protein